MPTHALWMAVDKGYQCAAQIHHDLVFPVKYRRVLLQDAMVTVIHEVATGIEERYGMEIG